MIVGTLCGLNLLIGDSLFKHRGIDKRILTTVALGDDGHNAQHLAVLMLAVGGLQTNRIVDGLVTHNLIRRDVHQTHRLGSRDDGSDILIDSELFHLLIGVLGLHT